MTDSWAGVESFGAEATTRPHSQSSPSSGGTDGPGGAPSAVPSTPGDPSREHPANSRRDYRGLIRPSSFPEGTQGFRVVIPPPAQGDRKKNRSGAQARSREEKEGQTLGQSVQRPPRPLREGSRGEEKPRCLSRGALTSPHPCAALRGRRDAALRRQQQPGRESREYATSAPG